MSDLPTRWPTIGDAIRSAREQQHMSMRELARVSGISLPSLRALEESRPNPGFDELLKIADALDTRPSVLLRDAEARLREATENQLGSAERRWTVRRSADELEATLTLTLRANWLVRLLTSRLFKRGD
jgi:transcriptional regulator with XRE-family HTH domain